MNKILAFDVETTISNKGNPFDVNNKWVLGACGTNELYTSYPIIQLNSLWNLLLSAEMVVLFNAKFDLHWARKYGFRSPPRMRIWDCQLAEFILSNQKNAYPSLEATAVKYGLGHKVDVIKEQYWSKGIDTDKIPFETLDTYLRQDIALTYLVYLKQVEEFKKPEHRSKYNLFRMQCYDLLVLEDMEYNGFLFDVENARKKSAELDQRKVEIENAILRIFPDIPINLSSGDHISCMLYGGSISQEYRVPIGVYKSGAKIGQPRFRIEVQKFDLPRRMEPPRGSELAKEGYWSTDEATLLTLKPDKETKKIIDLLLERRGLEKLRGTYYDGIPNKISDMNWADNMVHGNLNQCVARTSRLSATAPNQQNMPGDCKRLCISKYKD